MSGFLPHSVMGFSLPLMAMLVIYLACSVYLGLKSAKTLKRMRQFILANSQQLPVTLIATVYAIYIGIRATTEANGIIECLGLSCALLILRGPLRRLRGKRGLNLPHVKGYHYLNEAIHGLYTKLKNDSAVAIYITSTLTVILAQIVVIGCMLHKGLGMPISLGLLSGVGIALLELILRINGGENSNIREPQLIDIEKNMGCRSAHLHTLLMVCLSGIAVYSLLLHPGHGVIIWSTAFMIGAIAMLVDGLSLVMILLLGAACSQGLYALTTEIAILNNGVSAVGGASIFAATVVIVSGLLRYLLAGEVRAVLALNHAMQQDMHEDNANSRNTMDLLEDAKRALECAVHMAADKVIYGNYEVTVRPEQQVIIIEQQECLKVYDAIGSTYNLNQDRQAAEQDAAEEAELRYKGIESSLTKQHAI